MTDLYWDPYDTDIDDDPHPIWQRLRAESPVYRNDRFDFWALSRFEDVEKASKDTATFSSTHGTVLELMGPGMVGSNQMIFMDPPVQKTVRVRCADVNRNQSRDPGRR